MIEKPGEKKINGCALRTTNLHGPQAGAWEPEVQ
jgi:hypothetical protein